MASDIGVRLGGDNSEFRSMLTESEAVAAKFDAKLEASGVRFSSIPEKYAEASSKVFEQLMADEGEIEAARIQHAQDQQDRERKSAKDSAGVFEAALAHEDELANAAQKSAAAQKQAEADLAAYRQQVAYSRMSNEEKLAATQMQASGILKKIDGIEGDTLEKTQLQLDLEKKKTEIFDLNNAIKDEEKKKAEEIAEEQEKLNKKGGAFGNILEGLKKGFKDMGLSLEGAGIGVIFAAIIGLGKQAIDNAQKQRDEYEKIHKPLDANTESLSRFGDGLDSVKKGAVSTVGFILSGWTLIGDSIGSVINRMRGISEAQEVQAEASERAAKIAEERVKKLKEEQYDVEKIAAARKDTAAADKAAALEQMNDRARLLELQQRVIDAESKATNAVKGTVNEEKFKKDLIEAQNELRKETIAVLVRESDQRMAGIAAAGQLDVTFAQKKKTLLSEEVEIRQLLLKLKIGSNEYIAAEQKLQQNLNAQILIERDLRSQTALSAEDVLAKMRLQLGIDKENLPIRNLLNQHSKLELELKSKIFEISQRETYDIANKKNPEQDEQLKLLLMQEAAIEKKIVLNDTEIARAQVLRKAAGDRVEIDQSQLDALEKQATALGLQLDDIEKIKVALGGVVTKEQAAADAAAKHAEEEARVLGLVQARVSVEQTSTGNGYQSQSTDALQGIRKRVASSLDAASAADFGAAFHVGGAVHDPSIEVFRAQLEKIDRELKLRSDVQNYANQYGEGATRSAFGDSTTERALQNIRDDQTRGANALETISNQIAGVFPKKG